jgi:5-bromo-4-chloroindolyl phosphate hydrolysis protein
MSSETDTTNECHRNPWRRLHKLVLQVNEAKDFRAIGEALEAMRELYEIHRKETDCQDLNEMIFEAMVIARERLKNWLRVPPSLGPGNER